MISVRNLGTHYLAEFMVGGRALSAKLRRMAGTPGAGDRAWLRLPASHTLYYVNDKRVA